MNKIQNKKKLFTILRFYTPSFPDFYTELYTIVNKVGVQWYSSLMSMHEIFSLYNPGYTRVETYREIYERSTIGRIEKVKAENINLPKSEELHPIEWKKDEFGEFCTYIEAADYFAVTPKYINDLITKHKVIQPLQVEYQGRKVFRLRPADIEILEMFFAVKENMGFKPSQITKILENADYQWEQVLIVIWVGQSIGFLPETEATGKSSPMFRE